MLTILAVVILVAVISYVVWKKLTTPVSSVLGIATGLLGDVVGTVKKLLPGKK